VEYLTLTEHEEKRFSKAEISGREAEILRQRYDPYLDLTYPSPATEGKWVLEPGGHVGVLPLEENRALHVKPKGPIQNVFEMLEAIGSLPDIPEGASQVGAATDFTQQLVRMLAKRVIRRAREGLYRKYVSREEELPYVRGTIDVREHVRRPHRTKIPCRFEESKTDNELNRILAWTLYKVARSGLCSGETLRSAQVAYRSLAGRVSLDRVRPKDCIGRYYNRLNEDYRPMHGACYLLLKHMGLSHETGDRAVMPFVIDMPSVFEDYVVEMLRRQASEGRSVRSGVTHNHGFGHFEMDAVVYEKDSGEATSIVEVKYKYSDGPSSEDLQQAVAYASALDCSEALLVYPRATESDSTARIGGTEIRTVGISLEQDLRSKKKFGVLGRCLRT
jgi:5-methylcytosine-specific restriction enzyme subunit McrC